MLKHVLVALLALSPAWVVAAAPNSFILNEANTVSGDGDYLEDGKLDPAFGRLEGNGQNWLEFLVVQGSDLGGGNYANTLDLRGWKLEWSYFDESDKYGSGSITFKNDPLWAAVPRGTLLTISEWQKAWYTPVGIDPLSGNTNYERVGGINGLGNQRGQAYVEGEHHLVDFSTDTSWNPGANGGGSGGDWNLNVYAGERNPDTSFKYFEFEGTVIEPDGNDPGSDPDVFSIGLDNDAGIFAVNNDDWQITIKDSLGNTIQGPIGEHLPPNPTMGINSTEILKLESFVSSANPSLANYLSVTNSNYQDGSSSTFGDINIWDSGGSIQDLSLLRDWLKYGDADFDGEVTGLDLALWRQRAGDGWQNGDFDGDGVIGGLDLALWRLRTFVSDGSPLSMSALGFNSVPEPTSAVTAFLGAIGFGAFARTRSSRRR